MKIQSDVQAQYVKRIGEEITKQENNKKDA